MDRFSQGDLWCCHIIIGKEYCNISGNRTELVCVLASV